MKNRKSVEPVAILSLSGPPLAVDAEFKPKSMNNVFQRHGLAFGRCFGSKSGYRAAHPHCKFIPNANIFSESDGKVWWGDLDLHADKSTLEKIAKQLGYQLYILRESDGRFGKAVQPHTDVIERAVWHTGGPTRIPHLAGFLSRSGLTRADAAFLLKVMPQRLGRPQTPSISLEIGRRLKAFEGTFAPIGTDAAHQEWGLWWSRPRKELAGKSPIEVLKAGDTLDLEALTAPTMELALFAMELGYWKQI